MLESAKFSFTPDEPLGRNPFPREDKRHSRWLAASRLAKEYLALHHSTMLARMPPDGAAREEHQVWMVDLFAERFNIMAGTILAEFGGTYESVAECEKVVDKLAEFTLAEARKIDPSQSRIVTVKFLAELQIRLTQYREHSVGQAYKWVREAVESVHIRNRRDQAPADQQAGVAKVNEASPSTPAGFMPLAGDQTSTPSGATGANRQPRILIDDNISSRRSLKDFVDASRLQPPRKGGRLLKSETQSAHAAWIEKGRPEPITGKICDAISKTVYPAEFEKIRLGSKQHKRLRDRVRAAILRHEKRPSTESVS